MLRGPLGPGLIEVAGALLSGVAPGQVERFWQSRLTHLAPMFDAAIERGELPANVDREELFAMAAGPIYFRTFVSSQPYDDNWIMTVIDRVCTHYGLKA